MLEVPLSVSYLYNHLRNDAQGFALTIFYYSVRCGGVHF